MPRFALILRCLLIVAFCLDGGVSLWRASAMAVSMAERAEIVQPAGDHHPGSVQAASEGKACDIPTLPAGDAGHHACDCDASGTCPCPCAFAAKLIVQDIPFAAQHAVSLAPTVPLRTGLAAIPVSTVFRPPIA